LDPHAPLQLLCLHNPWQHFHHYLAPGLQQIVYPAGHCSTLHHGLHHYFSAGAAIALQAPALHAAPLFEALLHMAQQGRRLYGTL
jgi:hypothetical protein